MGLRRVTSLSALEAYGMEQYEQAEKALIEAMQYTGEGFVKDARSFTRAEGGFGDVTGNLRSSIGYFIVKDGEVIREDVQQSDKGTDRSTGVSVAKQFIDKIKKNNGLFLYGVAGMEYAQKLESRGYNVITLQSGMAAVELKDLLKGL